MLSICVPIKNRSKVITDKGVLRLFPNCIKSLASSLSLSDDVELVIADWQSTDWPLKEWIEDAIPHIPINIITINGSGFSAGLSRNIAADHSNGEILFFCDSDMILNSNVIHKGIEITKNNNVFYPTVKYEIDNNKQIIHEGGGNFFITKELFFNVGKFPEYYKHGFEDTDFVAKLKGIGNIVVDDTMSIYHQWHPQTKLFKDKYSNGDPNVDQRKEHYKKEVDKQPKTIARAIDIILHNNPNVTHNSLNTPVKGENRRLL